MTEERLKKHAQMHEDHLQSMVNNRNFVLRVTVKTKEEAQELLEWLHAKDSPMQTTLNSIEYDANRFVSHHFNHQ